MTAPTAVRQAPAQQFTPPPPSRTPQLLRRLQAAAALALVILGSLATWVIADLRTDLGSAPNFAAQYARLGEVQDRLLETSTLVTEGVIEAKGQASERIVAARVPLAEASRLLVDAATARPQDAAALAEVSGDVTAFGGLLIAADGRGQQAAKGYLTQADKLLDERILPELQSLREALTSQAAARPWTQSEFFVPILAVLVAGSLAWVSVVVARRTHRALNLGLVAGIIAALVILWVTSSAQQAGAAASDDTRGTQFTQVVNLSEATAHLGTAQRLQAQAVLNRSWTSSQAKAVAAEVDAAGAATDLATTRTALKNYRAAQQGLAALLAAGNWTDATSALLSRDGDQLESLAGKFHHIVDNARSAAVVDAADRPAQASSDLLWRLWAVVIISLAGAGLAVAGLGQRLAEYR